MQRKKTNKTIYDNPEKPIKQTSFLVKNMGENLPENWAKMSWTTNKVGSNDKNRKIDWFNPKKIVISIVWGDLFLYIPTKFDYKFLFLITTTFLFLFLDPFFQGLLWFILSLSSHLHPTCGQSIAYFDPCPISTLLKSLGVAVRLNKHCSEITSSLMRLES